MLTLTVDELQKNLNVYLHQLEVGEYIVVMQSGQPIAEIRPVASNINVSRPSGLCSGDFIVPDDFDAPLPDEILSSFDHR